MRTLAIAIAIALLLRAFIIKTYDVQGTSMAPSFATGDRVLVLEAAYWFHPPRPGQVVVLKPPIPSRDDFIKRVVAVGPATVELKAGALYVDGVLQPDAYVSSVYEDSSETQGPIPVPAGSVFVLGDHRDNSEDSHIFGPVSEKAIAGRVLFVWWPPSHFGGVPTKVARSRS